MGGVLDGGRSAITKIPGPLGEGGCCLVGKLHCQWRLATDRGGSGKCRGKARADGDRTGRGAGAGRRCTIQRDSIGTSGGIGMGRILLGGSAAIPESPGGGCGSWGRNIGKGDGCVEAACGWSFDGDGASGDRNRLGEGAGAAQAAGDGQCGTIAAGRGVGYIGRTGVGRGGRGGAVEAPIISEITGPGGLVGEIQ